MDELTALKHSFEQWGYQEIRSALQQDFVADPQKFLEDHKKRPEDMVGYELRRFYPHFLAQQRPVSSLHDGFRRRFLSGELFPRICG